MATGLFLHRPDKDQGVTTWCCGIGNNWEVEGNLKFIQLKSWKNDYVHRLVHGTLVKAITGIPR